MTSESAASHLSDAEADAPFDGYQVAATCLSVVRSPCRPPNWWSPRML
jgi:hypothetical protein